MPGPNLIVDKTFNFSKEIIKLYIDLKKDKKNLNWQANYSEVEQVSAQMLKRLRLRKVKEILHTKCLLQPKRLEKPAIG